MKVGRFRIKERIELEIMNQCDIARHAAMDSKTESEAKGHLKKIVRLLCTKWSSMLVFKRDLRHVDKILLAAGFNAGKSENEYDKDWLVNLTSWLAVYLGGLLPYQIGCGMTAKEAERTAKEIGHKRAQDGLRMLQIKINPEGMLKQLEEELSKYSKTEAEEISLMEPRTSPIKSMAAILRQAYRA